MTDTKEAYEKAVGSIEDVYTEECGCERCIEHKQRGAAIRAHVAALEGEIAELQERGRQLGQQLQLEKESSADGRDRIAELKDGWAEANEKHFAVVTELRRKLAALEEKNKRLMEASVELTRERDAEIAELKAERDEAQAAFFGAIRRVADAVENAAKYQRLWQAVSKSIESAPKVWLKWAKTADGRRSLDNAAATPQLECFGFQECYAVPVATEDSSVDHFRDVTKLVEEDR